MENNNSKETFSYKYSARQQEEIRSIRRKYAPDESEEDKVQKLIRLDRGVTKKANVVSLLAGIIGVLILGTGMSMIMVMDGTMFIPGIAVGILGLVVTALAYPVYQLIVKRERKRIAPEIMRLTDELMK